MNEILKAAEQDIAEEKLFKEQREKLKFSQNKEMTIVETAPQGSQQLQRADSEETQAVDSLSFSETWKPDVSRSVKLVNSSAFALHSHMKRILDTTEDVRPTFDRTEQAVQCAREIALLMKSQSELLRVMKD